MSQKYNSQEAAEERRLSGLQSFAQTYTQSTLGRNKNLQGVDRLIRKLDLVVNNEIDGIHAYILQRHEIDGSPDLDCKKGCGYCCSQTVGASIPEVLQVAAYVRANFSKKEIEALKERVNAYHDFNQAIAPDQRVFKSRPCPMLVDEACSVFESRPLTCRGFNSYDVEVCKRFQQTPGKVPVPSSVSQMQVTLRTRDGMFQALNDMGLSDTEVELAEAMKIALDNEDASDRYLAGEDLFESAKIIPPVQFG